MIDFELLALILLFGLIGFVILSKRKGVEFKYGITIKRWKSGLEGIDKFVKRNKRVLKFVGIISVIVCLIASFVGLYFLVKLPLEKKGGISIILPTIAGYKYPKPLIGISIWYWLPIIFIILLSHETMHAIFARLEKIRVKNYGIILFFVLPIGAFVDINMESVKRLRLIKKLKIFSAGSFANFLVAGFSFLLVLSLAWFINFTTYSIGIKYKVVKGSPADEVGLRGIILQIDENEIKSVNKLAEFMENKRPGEKIRIKTTEGVFEVRLSKHPENPKLGYIGIKDLRNVLVWKFNNSAVSEGFLNSFKHFINFFFLLFAISLGVGIVNLLPLKPLDGGYIFEEILSSLLGKNGKTIFNLLSISTLFLLFLNLFIGIFG